MELDGQVIDGRKIEVNYASPKSGGRGRGASMQGLSRRSGTGNYNQAYSNYSQPNYGQMYSYASGYTPMRHPDQTYQPHYVFSPYTATSSAANISYSQGYGYPQGWNQPPYSGYPGQGYQGYPQ